MSIEPHEKTPNKIFVKIQTFSVKKVYFDIHVNVSSPNEQLFILVSMC